MLLANENLSSSFLILQQKHEKALASIDKKKDEMKAEQKEFIRRQEGFEDEVKQATIRSAVSGAEKARALISTHSVFKHLATYDFRENPRIYSAVTSPISIASPVHISASMNGSHGAVYKVTLDNCTCEDFKKRGIPCKHMYRLALQFGLLMDFDSSVALQFIADMKKAKDASEQAAENAIHKERFVELAEKIKADATLRNPWLASQLADAEALADQQLANSLACRRPPALKASKHVSEISKEKTRWMRQAKALEYQLSLYEALVPWLQDAADYTPQELIDALANKDQEIIEDEALLGQWLSPAEYQKLTEVARFQLALDRWRKRPRSNWEVGRDFERYVGYQYEQKGFSVQYVGALTGKEDLGRDLIVRSGKELYIIQCKRWASQRTIHEKHVFQLFGSTITYEVENPGTHPKAILITTCPVSPLALSFADRLSVECQAEYPIKDLEKYPLIKCNVGKSGEKIFHLPFDQQYDRVSITLKRGEFYAHTVQEAMNAGFRRAHRWHSQKQ